MTHFLFATVFLFAGLAAAAAVLVTNIFRLLRPPQRFYPLLYLGVSVLTAASLLRTLARQSTGIACAMAPGRTMFLYGGLILLHLYFLWDSLRSMKGAEG